MDKHQQDAQPPSGRRRFLRQLGMTAVGTAALSGLADVVGLKPAAAVTRAERGRKVRGARSRAAVVPDVTVSGISMTCDVCEGCCGTPCTPSGVYCHYCNAITLVAGGGSAGGFAGYYCLGGNEYYAMSSSGDG
jgi:hypothetical protein